MENYSTAQNPVPGTGLAMLVRRDTGYQRLQVNSPLQTMAIRTCAGPNLLTICNIYLPPIVPLQYQDLVRLIYQLPRPFLIIGDFNCIHTIWGNDSCNQRGNIIEQPLVNTDLCLLNSGEMTHLHVQNGTTSAIDLSFCSPDIFPDMQWMVLDDLHGSDHFPILLKILCPQQHPGEPRFLMRKADWITFQALTEMDDSDETQSVDDLSNSLTQTIRTAASIAISRSKGGSIQHRVPWWTDDCTEANRRRKMALRRYQRTRSLVDKIAYNRARAKAQFIKKTAKAESWKRYISSINKDTPMHKIWQRIRKMRGRGQHGAPCVTVGATIVADPKDVANVLADHFAEVSSGTHWSQLFLDRKRAEERVPLRFATDDPLPYNEPITISELYQALLTCRNTAPGLDEIQYKMVRRLHPSAVQNLVYLYNKIWTSHQLPRQWRVAVTLAFHKPGKPTSMPSSYRPITLSSCLAKLMEKIVNSRLMKYLEANNLLTPHQFGFRRNCGTTDALVRLQNHVIRSKREGKHTLCVFFDMHKAYDTTWRRGILKALHRRGIRGNMSLYCQEFLGERFFRVRSGGAMSTIKTQVEGVPQGSVLSCTLFLLALNDITSNFPPGVHASLYVDDLMLYSSSRYVAALHRRMQNAINRCEAWAENNGFVFSAPKTVALHVAPGRSREILPALNLGGVPINLQDEVKFLGMIVDRKFSWLPHIKALKTKATKAMNLLKCLSGMSWGADRQSLLMLYRSVVRSKLDYGCIVYQAATKTNISLLDPVHNAALRLCTGAFRSSPMTSLYVESGEPPLELRRAQLSFQYLARLRQSTRSLTYDSVCVPHREDAVFPYYLPSSNAYDRLIIDTELQRFNVLPSSLKDIPVWRIPLDAFCTSCKYPNKLDCNAITMKQLFLEHLSDTHFNSEHIYTDGSKTDKAVGCAAIYRGTTRSEKLLPETSVFSSELHAIQLALDIIEASNHPTHTIFTDSLSALQAIKACDCCHPLISGILTKMIGLQDNHRKVYICWVPGHVDVPGNDCADREAKLAAASDNRRYYNQGVPCRDLYPNIKGSLMRYWQNKWDETENNKMKDIKETVRPWLSSNYKDRHMEVALCRLRIGHTRLTHGFLMDRSAPPFCMDCILPLTIKHIIAECPSFEAARQTHFPFIQSRDPAVILKSILGENPNRTFDHQPLKRLLMEIGIMNDL